MSRRRNDSRARLLEHLRELRLPAMRAQCRELAETARREGMGYEEYLLALCEAESQVRREHRVERLLRASRLPALTLTGWAGIQWPWSACSPRWPL